MFSISVSTARQGLTSYEYRSYEEGFIEYRTTGSGLGAVAATLRQRRSNGISGNPAGVGVEILAIAESASRVIVEVDARCLAVEHVSAIEEILCDRLAARLLRPSFSLTQGTQAYVHCILDSASTGFEQSTLTDIESIHRVVSGWSGEFATLVSGRNVPISLREHYSQVLPEEYRHEVSPVRAIEDVLRVESLGNGSVDVVLDVANSGAHVLSLYVLGRSIPLSAVLPVLRDLGTDVVDEKHYPVERVDGSQAWIYRFTLTSASARNHAPSSPSLAPRFAEAFLSMWDEAVESDGLGALIVGSELDVRQIAALRAYSHYLRQSGLPYSLARIESVLREHSKIATALIELFEVRHDPAFDAEARSLRAGLLTERIVGSINDVAELDADRILRALLSLIDNTLRTNYFYRDAGVSDPFLALKFDSRIIDVLPYPRPHFEIFVDSPRFEECIFDSAVRREVVYVGRIVERISEPRSSAWQRHSPRKTQSSSPLGRRVDSSSKNRQLDVVGTPRTTKAVTAIGCS